MTLDMGYALLILFIAIVLFVTEWLRVDIVALAVVVGLMLTGLLTTQEALSGFSNAAVLTIAALFVVGGGVLRTGLAGLIGQRILAVAGSSETRLVVVIMLAVALLSGVMSDTGTVAVLLPAIISLARSVEINPSRLLIPLSFGALLGGASTLIGTPPNIIVSDLLRKEGLTPFRFFDYTPIGLLLIASGILFMLFIGRRLLPEHEPRQDLQWVENPKELIARYQLPDNLFRLRVRRSSGLVGHTVAGSRLRQDFRLTVLEILRPAEPRSLLQVGDQRLLLQAAGLESMRPEPDTSWQVDDLLIVQGAGNDVAHAAAFWNLGVQPALAEDEQSLISQEAGLAEVLLPPRSTLVGKTLVETRFGTSYKLTVLGINRPGATEKLDLKETPLRFGDILLVQGPWQDILALRDHHREFVVMGQPEAMVGAPNRPKAPLALLVLMGMLILILTNVVPIAAASMLAALAMVLTGCLTMDEAYEAIDWKSVVLVAGMLPMSLALEKVEVVNLVAQGLTDSLGEVGPLVVMVGLFLLTSLFTQVLSNTATTVIIAPIALATAQELGVRPFAFLMMVAIAASMAFASPVASPVNTLVMGAGNYRFGDYIKIGVPMVLVMLVVTVLILPVLWPL
jgi:di/tricarboxylate transporter